MRKAISILQLFVFLGAVAFTALGQPISNKDIQQDTDILRNTMKVEELEGHGNQNAVNIDRLREAVNELRLEISNAKFAVYGFGICLTVLQSLHVLAMFKKQKPMMNVTET